MTRDPRRVARTLAALGSVLMAACTLLTVAPPAAAAPGPPDAPQYWFDRWNVYGLWDAGARGQGVTIAEIDTGVNAELPELQGRVLRGTDLGRSGDGRTDRDVSEFGHGTAMASIMVARPGTLGITGMAPDAKVLPIAVPLNGTTDAARPDRLPEAIRYAADHGARVISMSLGGKRYPASDQQSCPDDEQAAIFHAIRKGAIVVASIGNDGPTRNIVEEPGVCLGVVSVGAVDSRGRVADFSTRQPYLTLTAPGVAIASLGRVAGAAYSGDGTSQATAVVSAALALVWSKFPTATARTVLTRVLATLADRPAKHSNAYGYGTLDAGRAVRASVPASAANPVFAVAEPFLARDRAFAAGTDTDGRAVPAPAPARGSDAGTGRCEVGSVPRLTPQVRYGALAAGVGLVATLLLALVGRRRHRARGRARAALPTPSPVPTPGPPPPRPDELAWRDVPDGD